jgi:DNA primase
MRAQVSALVERHLGRIRRFSGESNATMRCPFHKGGQEAKPSFSINIDLGIFYCFTCKASGNIIQLLTLLGLPKDQVDLETKDIRDELEANKLRLFWKKRTKWRISDPMQAQTILPEKIIRPYEWCPVSLIEYGFRQDLLQYMEVGFDRMNQRITYPVRDLYGNLAGVVGGAAVAGQYPKYKVYKGRWKSPTGEDIPSDYGPDFEEEYPNYEFHNHDHIWNYYRVYPRLFFSREENQQLIIVEGYKACLWLLQNGYWNVIALMGSALSDRQFELLFRLRVNFILFLDNDEAGLIGSEKIGKKLYLANPGVHIAQYPTDAEDGQPDDLSSSELSTAIQSAQHFPQFMKERRYGINGRITPWCGPTQ